MMSGSGCESEVESGRKEVLWLLEGAVEIGGAYVGRGR